jgi:hypothetical protein
MPAAWALWRIDPAFSDSVTPVLARFLAFNPQPDRLDRLSRVALSPRKDVFNTPFGPRLAAAGELWQMHPEKRDALNPFIVALLREWASDKVLKTLSPETRAAIPALEEIESHSPLPKLRLLARAALRKIATTDYGSW